METFYHALASPIGGGMDKFCSWCKDWPKKKGWYWFYGTRFRPMPGDSPELSAVEVRSVRGGGNVYITRGHFLYKSEGAMGLWCIAIIPPLPVCIQPMRNVNTEGGL